MLKPLQNLPAVDPKAFHEQVVGAWNDLEPGHRVVIEWLTGENTGPHVFVYPAGDRAAGTQMLQRLSFGSVDERWADFLEFEYIPQLVKALQNEGFRPQVICADLRPLQVQRARRRQIEAAASAKTGRPISLNQQEAEGEGTGQ